MTPAEIKAALLASIEQSEHVYTQHLSSLAAREKYIADGRKHLLESLIEPVPVEVRATAVGEQTFGAVYKGYAVAYSDYDSRWLIYSPEKQLFNIAWGRRGGPFAERLASLEDTDWWSDDALAIWLL